VVKLGLEPQNGGASIKIILCSIGLCHKNEKLKKIPRFLLNVQ